MLCKCEWFYVCLVLNQISLLVERVGGLVTLVWVGLGYIGIELMDDNSSYMCCGCSLAD
jgi:hypothetical protein